MDTRISGTTRLLGIIGSPVNRVGSPVMYNFCFDHYKLDYVYMAFDCREDQVKETLDAVRRLNMRGVSVTMPCKREAARLADRLSPAARFAGAVNTIVNDGGILTGHITDGLGLVLDLKAHGKAVRDKNIVLLGTGGASSAILVQCALEKAASITVFNRTGPGLDRARSIGDRMRAEGISCRLEYHLLNDSELLSQKIRSSDILINATPVGMHPDQEGKSLVSDLSAFHKDLIVYDVICDPKRNPPHGGRPAKRMLRRKCFWRRRNASLAGSRSLPSVYRASHAVKELSAFLKSVSRLASFPIPEYNGKS